MTFEEAAEVFYDTLSGTMNDPAHADDEDRFIILGMTEAYRLLFVSFTERDDTIRIISASGDTEGEKTL